MQWDDLIMLKSRDGLNQIIQKHLHQLTYFSFKMQNLFFSNFQKAISF